MTPAPKRKAGGLSSLPMRWFSHQATSYGRCHNNLHCAYKLSGHFMTKTHPTNIICAVPCFYHEPNCWCWIESLALENRSLGESRKQTITWVEVWLGYSYSIMGCDTAERQELLYGVILQGCMYPICHEATARQQRLGRREHHCCALLGEGHTW